MAKLTLLEMVQDILSDLDSDEVNDVSETFEAEQVASIIKTTYFEFISQRDWPWLMQLDQLESASMALPVKMKMPDTTSKIYWIKYDTRVLVGDDINFSQIAYKDPEAFMRLTDGHSSSDSTVDTLTDDGLTIFIKNDTAPTYWTSFDDEYIYFNSYDSALESNLAGNKTKIFGVKETAWSNTNTFVPDLPSHLFPTVLAEAKSVAFLVSKQTVSEKDEQRARRGRGRMQHASWRQSTSNDTGPDYGRK